MRTEIPVWMFDRIASAHWRTMPVPHVERERNEWPTAFMIDG
ncbi:UNVERIFIED_ORG: hypothetical protein J2W85_007160 [Ensifer adhaerens]|nr:hypothetical protein [Ensifer adhaerens]